MPELPEVETTARGLRRLIVGRTVVGVSGVDWPRMLPNTSEDRLDALLRGRSVAAVDRRGKYLLLRFERGAHVAIHRKMTGNLLLRQRGDAAERHTHLTIGLDDGCELRFVDPRKFGRVYAFESQAELEAFLAGRLGPEPLAELDAETLARRLAGRRGRIKSLLLDQTFLAGVGNLYADEALWEAGIHPMRPADSLTSGEIERLAGAIKHVLELAIERRGTSFSDYRDAEGLLGENQDYLNVYGRAASGSRPAQLCPRCGASIERLLVGQRSSHFCPRCQRQGRVVEAATRPRPR